MAQRPAGWVAGDVISTPDDPNRGKWLSVWGSAYSYPALHATREAAAAVTTLRGACVAHVTEYPMPAGIGMVYAVTPGTLANRADPAAPPADFDGNPVT
jgi:hypothetical protein